MEENPFSSILNTLRQDADGRSFWPWQLGEVVSVEPLIIRTGDHELQGEDLWVNYQIIENEEEAEFLEILGWLEGAVSCPNCGNPFRFDVARGELAVEGIFKGVLHPGDRVVLLAGQEGQHFVVLCRVVSA